jgi:hypothetical protein
MAAGVGALVWALRSHAGPAARLLFGVAAGAVTYPVLLQLLRQAPAHEIRSLWEAGTMASDGAAGA